MMHERVNFTSEFYNRTLYFSYETPSYLDLFCMKVGRGECWSIFLESGGWWSVDGGSIFGSGS